MSKQAGQSNSTAVVPAALPGVKPTKQDLLAARNKALADLIAPDLKVLFCGINPGLYTAAIGHHFGRPGNRFWKAMHDGGFTPRVLSPFEEKELLPLGYGITNLVSRATATADELSRDEIVEGGRVLTQKVRQFRPRVLAVVGMGAYRVAFGRAGAVVGLQPESIGQTTLWVLPNPSGLNAHYQPRDLGRVFGELRQWVQERAQ